MTGSRRSESLVVPFGVLVIVCMPSEEVIPRPVLWQRFASVEVVMKVLYIVSIAGYQSGFPRAEPHSELHLPNVSRPRRLCFLLRGLKQDLSLGHYPDCGEQLVASSQLPKHSKTMFPSHVWSYVQLDERHSNGHPLPRCRSCN